jgi:hypothetical protein
MDGSFCLSVMIETDDRASLDQWADWILTSNRLKRICAAGAASAEMVKFEGTPHTMEVRFHFATREALETYERESAPTFKQEQSDAVKRFGFPIRFQRKVGPLTTRVMK